MEHYVRFSSFGENRVKVDRPTCWLSIICRKTFFLLCIIHRARSQWLVVSCGLNSRRDYERRSVGSGHTQTVVSS